MSIITLINNTMAKTNLKNQNGTLVLYTGPKGSVELRADTDKETIWASLNQISELFGRDKSVISKHIKDIFNSGEVDKKATVAKNATVQTEGGREVIRDIESYNLDVILSVGYRVNSKKATRFRIWATKTLREYLIKGFKFDSQKLQKEPERFEDLRDAIVFIESKTHGKVKGKLTLKLTKEII